MPVPKPKRSRARRDSRFANKGIKVKAITSCKNCQTPSVPHAACKECGYYKGVKVLTTKSERSVKRTQTRQVQAARKAEKAPAAPQE